MTILDKQTASTPVVVQEEISTTEWKIIQVKENIEERVVMAFIELGPYTTETRGPEGRQTTVTTPSGHRNIVVWHGEEYDAIRDTWTNADLIAAIAAKLG